MTHPSDFHHWRILIRPGSPGDVFRLLHGAQCRFEGQGCCVMCAAEDLPNIGRLLSENVEPVNDREPGWTLWRTGAIHWLAFDGIGPLDGQERKIAGFLRRWKECFSSRLGFGARQIWTSFSDARIKQQGHKKKLLPGSVQRIDCQGGCPKFPSRTANFAGVPAYAIGDPEPLRVAVVLRGDGKGQRDSPGYHKDARFLEQAFGNDVEFAFFGYANEQSKNWPSWSTRKPFAGRSLLEQIRDAQTYHLAMGVNSSALDVFSLAGVPVLRECEFQGVMKRGWPFRRKFNSFLCGNVNVGLGIRRSARGSRAWEDASRLQRCSQLLVSCQPWRLTPAWGSDSTRHVYVGPNFNWTSVERKVRSICGVA